MVRSTSLLTSAVWCRPRAVDAGRWSAWRRCRLRRSARRASRAARSRPTASGSVVMTANLLVEVGVGDLSQPLQRLAELSHPARPEVVGPLLLDALLLGPRQGEDLQGEWGQPDQPRPTVGRVGDALDVAGPLE